MRQDRAAENFVAVGIKPRCHLSKLACLGKCGAAAQIAPVVHHVDLLQLIKFFLQTDGAWVRPGGDAQTMQCSLQTLHMFISTFFAAAHAVATLEHASKTCFSFWEFFKP